MGVQLGASGEVVLHLGSAELPDGLQEVGAGHVALCSPAGSSRVVPHQAAEVGVRRRGPAGDPGVPA